MCPRSSTNSSWTCFVADRRWPPTCWSTPGLLTAEVRPGGGGRREDKRKRFTWPAYAGTLYARLKCPVFLLVVCPDNRVTTWCAEPIVFGDPPHFTLVPGVLDMRAAPRITGIRAAERSPELAVLSALAHGGKPGSTPVLKAFAAGLGKVDDDHAALFYDYVWSTLPAAARAVLRSLMCFVETYRPVSDWGRRHFRNGERKGKAMGEAQALLTVLDARSFDISEDVHARITGCTDIGQLDTWIRRAVTIEKVDELFD